MAGEPTLPCLHTRQVSDGSLTLLARAEQCDRNPYQIKRLHSNTKSNAMCHCGS